jgi:hypothetical protein
MKYRSRTLVVVSVVLIGLPAWQALGQPAAGQALTIGGTQKARADSDNPAVYKFVASGPGLLTVATRGTGSADLMISIADEDGQALPEGMSDRDLGGSSSAEQVVVALPARGTYSVRVEARGSGEAAFVLGASWLPFAELGAAPDPDGRPASARPLAVGKPHEDVLDGAAGDLRDWFAVTPSEAGMLVVVIRGTDATEGDLMLEAFAAGAFTRAVSQSDSDMQGDRKHESVTVPVKPGEKLYVRVSMRSSRAPVPYRISAGLVPQ